MTCLTQNCPGRAAATTMQMPPHRKPAKAPIPSRWHSRLPPWPRRCRACRSWRAQLLPSSMRPTLKRGRSRLSPRLARHRLLPRASEQPKAVIPAASPRPRHRRTRGRSAIPVRGALRFLPRCKRSPEKHQHSRPQRLIPQWWRFPAGDPPRAIRLEPANSPRRRSTGPQFHASPRRPHHPLRQELWLTRALFHSAAWCLPQRQITRPRQTRRPRRPPRWPPPKCPT